MDFGTIDFQYAQHLATRPPEEDGPIWMVNFMRYKERAEYGEGGEAISGREADDRYAPVEVLAAIGAEVAYFGDAIGPDGGPDPDWHRMAIVRYPTRRSFIEMQERPDFKEKRLHKDAGMEFTIIMGSVPAGPPVGQPDTSGVVRFIAYPPGAVPLGTATEGATFDVEGTIVGDERRWHRLVISWSDRGEDQPEGTMVVRSKPLIDQVRHLVLESLEG